MEDHAKSSLGLLYLFSIMIFKGPINMAGWLSSTTVIPLVEMTDQTRIAGASNGYKRYKDDHDERHELVNFVQFPTNENKDW
jgi:hypothetical protein